MMRIEYRLIMTHKNGDLDPDSGIKIFPLMPRPAHEIEKLQKEESSLFTKIKTNI
jgi:hypothetical protein